MKNKLLKTGLLFLLSNVLLSQNTNYWQQKVDYKIIVSVDTKNYQYKGKQELVYTNCSPDTLKRVYFHLYNNAFQPGSEMDIRIQNIKDPDARMVQKVKVDDTEVKESRIKTLKPNEIGYLKVSNFKQNGILANTKTTGTILEISLPKPIFPNSTTTFSLEFEGQIPLQIRRSGRNNSEKVALSMAQWYPKIAEFDFEGWHTDSYIGREFYGVWGNFDVQISIDKDYILGGSGYLQNGNEIGHGYQTTNLEVSYPKNTEKLTWHFIAPMVHDFTWAADKDYKHDKVKGPNNVDLHFLYKNNPQIIENWKKLQPYMIKVLEYFNKNIGNYPYKQYSFIQAGDGGMEYAMCTLLLGEGKFEGLLATATHEFAHSWFQHVLATNESKHPWMDEGFTSYIENYALNEMAIKKLENPFKGIYTAYKNLVQSKKEEPLTTHADRYDENKRYSISSYAKGSIFLSQLGYLIGQKNLEKTIKKYYHDFKFKHPTPNDFKRTAERITGSNLDWYLNEWTQTTNTIDYGIKEVIEINTLNTAISIERIGRIPMPIDLKIEYMDGTLESFYIPLQMLFFIKENPSLEIKRTVLEEWVWAKPIYTFKISKPKNTIKKITIDPSELMADINENNNTYPLNKDK